MEILLASQSPRRRELLGQMGLTGFRAEGMDIDEEALAALPPVEMVEQLSAGKAGAAAALAGEDTVIIGADTVVICDGKVFGKPRDGQDAVRMLTALSGREHEVCTGVTVRRGGRVLTGHELTRVRFRALSREEIDAYVATGEPMDKAGAYGIQGRGALLVEGIVGDYYNVMGLPVCRLGQMLRQFGVECLGQRNG